MKPRRTGFVTLIVGLVVISASSCTSLSTEPQLPKPRDDIELEEPKRPEIHLGSEGHLVVGAKHRELSWQVSDPSGLASVEARVLKIEESTMVSTEVHRSNRPSGRVDLNALGHGPSLYALVVEAVNNEKNQSEAGIRFSYADSTSDCPSEKAWWPRAESSLGISEGVQAPIPDRSAEKYNLLGLSRLSRFAVTGIVSDLVACLTKDRDVLLTFYDFPAEHWGHIRTTNPIESTFATVRLRHKKTKGNGSRRACLAMVFKLCLSAEKRWRRLNGHVFIQDVIVGVTFVDGIKQQAA